MPKRRRKGPEATSLLLLDVVLIFWGVVKIIGSIGVGICVVAAVSIVVAFIWYKVGQRAARLAALRAKYGDEEIVQRLMQHNYWKGQTAEQLRDSLGDPASVDGGLLKTRKREVWKYQPNGKNRYRLRITLDDDMVADFYQKN